MSRVIENDHPWTEDEIAYQLTRGRVKEVELNKKKFPPGSEVVEPEEDSHVLELSQKVYEFVSSRTLPQLKAELKKAHISVDFSDEAEMRFALAEYLQEQEDAANS